MSDEVALGQALNHLCRGSCTDAHEFSQHGGFDDRIRLIIVDFKQSFEIHLFEFTENGHSSPTSAMNSLRQAGHLALTGRRSIGTRRRCSQLGQDS